MTPEEIQGLLAKRDQLRKEIEHEKIQHLQKRHAELKSQQMKEHVADESALKSTGRGALAGIWGLGDEPGMHPMEAAYAGPEGVKEYNEGKRETEEYLHEPAPSTLGRIGHSVAKFAAPMAAFPAPGTGAIKTASKFLPGVASAAMRAAGHGAKAGALSGVAQELGVPQSIADLAAPFASPFVRNPMNYLKNASEKQAGNILHQATEGMSPHKAAQAIQFKEKMTPFDAQLGAVEAGEHTRGHLGQRVSELKKVRHEETKPLYDKIEQLKDRIEVPSTMEFFNKELPVQKSQIRRTLEEHKKELLRNHKPEKIPGHAVLKKLQVSPQIREQIERGVPKQHSKVLPIEIENQLKAVRDDIINSTGSERKYLIELKDQLEDDLRRIPEGLKHTEKYAELSTPINEILSQTTFGNILGKEKGTGFFKMDPNRVIKTISQSASKASKLLETFKNAPDKLNAAKQYNNFSFIDAVRNENGSINLHKLKSWKTANPGAFVLEPTLWKNLEDAAAAQKFATKIDVLAGNKTFKEGIDSLPYNMAKKFLPSMGRNAGIVRTIFKKVTDPAIKNARNILLERSKEDAKLAEMLITNFRDKKLMFERINAIPYASLKSIADSLQPNTD